MSFVTRKFLVNGRHVLRCCLSCLGLLPWSSRKDNTTCDWDQIAKISVLIAASLVSVAYEVIAKTASLVNKPGGSVTVFYVVQYSQYWIKSIAVLIILVKFYRQSQGSERIREQLDRFPDPVEPAKGHQRNIGSGMERAIIGITSFAFVVYILVMVISRAVTVAQYPAGDWPVKPFLGIHLNELQAHMLMLWTRNSTEAIRLLCSAYLGILLTRFARSLVVQCQTCLERVSAENSGLKNSDVEEAWNAREMALTMTGIIEREVGALLSIILIADILCLNASFANFLFPLDFLDMGDQVRNGAAILLYLASVFCTTCGIIMLGDIDDETLKLIKQLQSGNAYCMMFNKERSSTSRVLKNWKLLTMEQGQEKQEDPDVVLPLYMLHSSCFGSRKVAPCIPGFSHVTRATIISASGLLLTFFCFMLDQLGREKETSVTNGLRLLQNYTDSDAE